MDPQPGPSRSKDIRCRVRKDPKRSLKRYKLDKEVNSTTIDFLPNEIMVKIFKYLSIEDRLKVQKVCSRWRRLVRSDIMWRYVNFSDLSPLFFMPIIASLPSCVSHFKLECECWCWMFPPSLSKFMAELHRQWPFLKSLILSKTLKTANFLQEYVYLSELELDMKIEILRLDTLPNPDTDLKFCEGENIGLPNSYFPELKILSLRQVLFSQSHILSLLSTSFLSKITVLDLSYSRPYPMTDFDEDLFSTLTCLEELYLTGWWFNEYSMLNFLKNAKKLRVLDLEFSHVSDNTVSVLKQNNTWLEELYLSDTDIGDICRNSEDKEFFPRLKSLCVKYTKVTPSGIEKLLATCPSLKLVNVNQSKQFTDIWYHSLSQDLKERVILSTIVCYCDHFLKSKYCDF